MTVGTWKQERRLYFLRLMVLTGGNVAKMSIISELSRATIHAQIKEMDLVADLKAARKSKIRGHQPQFPVEFK